MMAVAVIGGGAWGTALAHVAAIAGREVLLWCRSAQVATAINTKNQNPDYLPGVKLARDIGATTDLGAVTGADVILLAPPAQHLRSVLRLLPATKAPLVICAKGIEQATGARLSEVVGAERPDNPVAVLSGPSFAHEVAAGLPTAVTLACADADLGRDISLALQTPTFRPYWSDDVVGVEIGGAVKNVLALAAGIVVGRALGENARAAIIARGLAEIVRLGTALGARPETFSGLSGLGDLVLTATSLRSRNTSAGYALGQGRALSQVLASRRGVTEGVFTASAVAAMAQEKNIDLPICGAVDGVVSGCLTVDQAIALLLRRPLRAEA